MLTEIKYNTLRGLRVMHGKRCEDIANHLGITKKTYWLKETGKTDFTITEAKLIAHYFGKKIDEVFN